MNNGLVIPAGTLLAQDGLTTNGLTNAGSINVSGGTLEVSGSYDTGSLNHITAANPVILAGTLDNVGQTVTLLSGGQLGTINGGTIALGGGLVRTGAFNGVVVDGVLSVEGPVEITNGLTVTGDKFISISDPGVLEFTGDQIKVSTALTSRLSAALSPITISRLNLAYL